MDVNTRQYGNMPPFEDTCAQYFPHGNVIGHGITHVEYDQYGNLIRR